MPLMFAPRAAPALAAALLLAACEDEAAEVPRDTEQGGKAAGEVLGGAISDDMLPLERLRSQSPPLEPEPAAEREGETGSGGEADTGDNASTGSEAGDTDDPPAPIPAPAPTPTPTGPTVAPPVVD